MTEDHPQDVVLVACRRIGEAMDLFDEAACAALGVGRSDLRALNLLEHGPLGHAAIGRRLGLSRAAVTGLVDRLVAAGYVERQAAAHDRRVVLVGLRSETFRAFALVYRPLGERVRRAVGSMSPQERSAVGRALHEMAAAFDESRGALHEAASPA